MYNTQIKLISKKIFSDQLILFIKLAREYFILSDMLLCSIIHFKVYSIFRETKT